MSAPAPTRPPTSGSTAAFVAIMSVMAAVALSVLLLHATIALTAHANGHPAPPLASTARAVVARPGDPVSALGEPIGPTWPPYALWGVALGLLLLAGWRVLLAWGRRRYREAPTSASLAAAADVAPLQEQQAVATARRIGGDAVANMSSQDLVVPLGRVGSKRIYLQHELSLLGIAPSRSGKTSNCVIGWVLDAPGPVIATSTKSDVPYLTILARRRLGDVYVLDLRDITGWPEKVSWDLVGGCEDPSEAVARATAMAGAAPSGGTTNGDWFNALAARVLGYLLHAAALKPGGTARDVLAWASDLDNPEPVDALRQLGVPRPTEDRPDTSSWADLLASQTRNESEQTVGSMQITLLGVLEPLSDPAVMTAVCPQPGTTPFDVNHFLTTRSTLYLLSKGGRKSVAPVITAFADMILRTADEMSQRLPGGRFWPPVSLVGDEIANIAPLPDLDQLISDSGGRGISVRMIAQTKAQLVKRWGREQTEAIFAGVNALLALPSITEPDVLRHLSFLTGQHRVARFSVTESDGRTSATTSGERENRMAEDEIHNMPMGTALLIAGNMPAVHLRLTPWQERPDADQLRQDSLEVERLTGRRMEQ
ncbi:MULTISPECIES: type IV secretory system conjugative DNA transfer family protein [unclassified Cellulomonas]|uniref:type IV secretory system conjugative DNA transfer family protein n=1 Tax=unclassified Cellulomonas TaxID=2620175 RepID=UPI001C4FA3B4|nr:MULTISPECIES: TraM recognition domain-containing protein [unclassified Cellulomonas]MBW0255822.1 TraM recognition domain-containing protein [Cellulomonas sp. PS-H5]MCG7284624.1 TraM recognition domain-containing protein [Cellulomonas sp. ACRRI]